VVQMFGRVVVRAPWLVIAAWVALVVVLAIAFPALTKIVENQTMQPLPPEAMAATQQMATDFGDTAQNILVVVMSDDQGLKPADDQTYRTLADKLRGDGQDVATVEDFLSTPALRQLMVSKDNKAFYMAVTLKAPAGSPESSEAYRRVDQIIAQTTAGSALKTHVTGEAAVIGDMSIVSSRDMRLIGIATAIMVMVILLVIYRRLATALLPLITIVFSVAAAQGVVSALTTLGLNVTATTVMLMTAMIVGAGTDYAVFLISRYHEYLGSGADSDEAVQKALGSIGKVIAASAATVAVTFFGMIFTRLPAFTSVGPGLAVSIAVAFFAAVTLLPAILVLVGRRGWVKPRAPLTSRLWQRSAIQLVRRPRSHLFVSLGVLLALGSCALMMHPTFNDRMQLPASAESNQGYSEMAQHFSTNALLPEYIYIRSPHDLRNPQSLADMEQLAQRVAQLPDVTAVRGITRPTGQPLDQTKVSYQAGQVGSKLADASSQINSKTSDLNALSGGAQKLADSLAAVRDQIQTTANSMTAMTGTLTKVQQQLASPQTTQVLDTIRSYANDQTAVNGVVNNANAMLDALNNSPQCDADPACSNGRATLAQLAAGGPGASAQDVLAKVEQLSNLLQSAGTDLQSTGVGNPAAAQQKMAQMEQGANALADSSQQLATGVKTLVDQTKRMGVGMTQAADLLNSIKQDASQPSMAGMYVPSSLLTTQDFKNAAKLYISPDGHSARYLVESKFDPFSTAAMDQVQPILDTARAAQPNTTLSGATISMVGTTPMYATIRSYYDHDVRLIVVMTLLVVFLILVALLRALVAPLYLIASVVISYLSALGLGVVFFQFILGQQIYWNVPATAFIVLVAVGADYNLLLISRIREESRYGVRSGIIRAVRSTGGVITSAGIIFAGSMFGLLFGSLSTMVQTGFIIGMGLLIDTFVVRTITVPALASLIGRANWWPSKAATRGPAPR
jgi:putative drug exporter of the RND superfamily